MNSGSLSYVTVKPSTTTLDGRPVPAATYYVVALTPTPTTTGGWALFWTLEDSSGGMWTVEETAVVGSPPTPFPTLPAPTPKTP